MKATIHAYVETGEPMSIDEIENAIEDAGDEKFHEYIESVDVVCPEVPEHAVAGYFTVEVPQDRCRGMQTEVEWYVEGVLNERINSDPDHGLLKTRLEEACDHTEVRAVPTNGNGAVDKCEDCGQYL